MIGAITSSTLPSATTTSIFILGRRLTLYSLPRYTAVWPFCLPCPRTSVTVMPEMLSFASASFTSSTLFGRTTALINFTSALQHLCEIRHQGGHGRLRELVPARGHVKHVDRLLALGRDQHEVDIARMARDHAADAMQQTDRVVRDDVEDRIPPRRVIVAVDDRREPRDAAAAIQHA